MGELGIIAMVQGPGAHLKNLGRTKNNFEQTKKRPGSVRYLGGGFKHFLYSPLPREDCHFDSYFSDGLKPPSTYIRD